MSVPCLEAFSDFLLASMEVTHGPFYFWSLVTLLSSAPTRCIRLIPSSCLPIPSSSVSRTQQLMGLLSLYCGIMGLLSLNLWA